MKEKKEEQGPLCETTRTNFAFKGWNTKGNGSGSIITKHTKVGDCDISVYALWNEIFELKFNVDGEELCNPDYIRKENGEYLVRIQLESEPDNLK